MSENNYNLREQCMVYTYSVVGLQLFDDHSCHSTIPCHQYMQGNLMLYHNCKQPSNPERECTKLCIVLTVILAVTEHDTCAEVVLGVGWSKLYCLSILVELMCLMAIGNSIQTSSCTHAM